MINKLIRTDIDEYIPYQPSPILSELVKKYNIDKKNILKLDTGENGYVGGTLYLYPDPLAQNLRKKIAQYIELSKNYVMCGNGSDELIDLTIRLFTNPGEEIIICPPTFPMYEIFGKINRCTVKKVNRGARFEVLIDEVIRSITPKTKIIFIDSPGNPTSIYTSSLSIEKLLKKNVMVVADEAYFEYRNKSSLKLLKKYPNLIVLRTMSKWAGLAALRIGYLIARPDVINYFLRIKPPYNVNALAQSIACDTFDNANLVLKKLNTLTRERVDLFKLLKKNKYLITYPSEGAYIIVKPKRSAKKLYEFLRLKGIFLKFINQPLLRNVFRINICQKEEMQIIINFINEFYEK